MDLARDDMLHIDGDNALATECVVVYGIFITAAVTTESVIIIVMVLVYNRRCCSDNYY